MVEISKIVEQNLWWRFGCDFLYYDKIMKEYKGAEVKFERKGIDLETSNIYAIHGLRQVGKTTEIKKKILRLMRDEGVDPDSICYFSCETLVSRRELRKVLDFFLDKLVEHGRIYVFLDEINFVKDWVLEIKRIADSDKFDRVVILFTGSPFGIKVHTHELIGRNVEGNRYFLRPLSFRDFVLQICQQRYYLTSDRVLERELEILPENLSSNTVSLEEPLEKIVPFFRRMLKFDASLRFLFNIYLKTGGFPSVINDYLRSSRVKERERVKPEFYERFIELVTKDALKQGKSDRTMQQVISAIIKKFGSRYDFRGLTEEIEEPISHPTVIDYLRLMEDNFLVHVLYSYDFSKKMGRSKGMKKIYFTDPLIFHSFNSWLHGKPGYSYSEEFVLDEEKVSLLVEGIVGNHLARVKEVPIIKPADRFLWFYYDARKELDFVYQRENGEYFGIEVKYKPRVSFKDVATLSMPKEYLILSKREFDTKGNIAIVPVYIFLCLLESSGNNL
uniref:AAA+ ATPase domain-containing protein n=1 Tax=Candidatus Methanophagaceae archaeon ANME-1 ERB6 TaxID=2759912 RepID=A0A7G9Z196_9EURY|nr:hypothetical protein KFAGBJAM_00011 [Methanosarcinales archaeon ANME-1 ERB6]